MHISCVYYVTFFGCVRPECVLPVSDSELHKGRDCCQGVEGNVGRCLWILERQNQLKTGWKQQAHSHSEKQVVLYACFHLALKEHSEMPVYLKRTDSVMGNVIKKKVQCSNPKQLVTTSKNQHWDANTRITYVT